MSETRRISITTLARRWGVSWSTVRRMIDTGEVAAIKVRTQFKIAMASVYDYETKSAF